MTNIPNGVRSDTIENTEFEAGLILKNKFTSSDSFNKENDVLCATTGGIKVVISQVKQVVKFDGIMDNTAGVERVIGWTASVTFKTKEVDSEKVKLALGYADIDTSVANKRKVLLKQGIIPVERYQDLYILGKLGDGSWRQIVVSKAMNVSGLNETRNDKNETEIEFDLRANYGIDTQDTPPVDIEYLFEEDQPSGGIDLVALKSTDALSEVGLYCDVNKTKEQVDAIIHEIVKDVTPVTGDYIVYGFGGASAYPYLKFLGQSITGATPRYYIKYKAAVSYNEVTLYSNSFMNNGWDLSHIDLTTGQVGGTDATMPSTAIGTLSGEGWNGVIIGTVEAENDQV